MKKFSNILLICLCLGTMMLLTSCDIGDNPPKGDTPSGDTPAGEQKRVCTVCETSETNAIAATGVHMWGETECADCGKKITQGLEYTEINEGAAHEVSGTAISAADLADAATYLPILMTITIGIAARIKTRVINKAKEPRQRLGSFAIQLVIIY